MKSKMATTIETGYWVAAVVQDGAAPHRCYVGQVQSVDEHGIRLTLVEWITGSATGYDLFIGWASLQTALVATPDHDLESFGIEAAEWQKRSERESAEVSK